MFTVQRVRRVSRWRSCAVLTLATLLVALGAGALPAAAAPGPAPWPLPGSDARTTKPPATPSRYYTYQPIDPAGGFLKIPKAQWDDPLNNKFLQGLGDHEDYQPGQKEHLLTAWRDYKTTGGKYDWEKYVRKYTGALTNGRVGAAFETKFYGDERINQSTGWLVNGKIPGVTVMDPKKPTAELNYRVDGYLATGRPCILLEVKSGAGVRLAQLQLLVQLAQRLGCRIVYVFAKQPTAAARKALEAANAELAKTLGAKLGGQDPIAIQRWDAAAQPRASAAASAANAGALAAGKQLSAGSAVTDAVESSPASAEDAAEEAKIEQAVADGLERQQAAAPKAAAAGPPLNVDDVASPDPLGGVDFSTLQLRYISDTYQGTTGVKYAYRVDPAPNQEVSYGGANAAQLASDSFFVWLALPADSFTVNLNPEEPNRIIDQRFGTTDAGRVLLEADLQMKKTVAKLIHPDTAQGRRFWDLLTGDEKCISMRQWIVPAPAIVRDNGNELFILDAPLQVKMETEYRKITGAAECPGQATSDTQHNETVFRTLILPQVRRAVNTAAEYADLRRVYASRVAAQWYRERSATKHTAYGDLVDKGDVSPWPLRQPWSPKDVFDRYVKSYKDGEFNVQHTTQQGDTIYTRTFIYGGVDFTTIPRRGISKAQFAKTHPGLSSAVTNAIAGPTAEDGAKEVWLGGQSTDRPLADAVRLPRSPLTMPLFYVLTPLPVAIWLVLGVLMLRRERIRRPERAAVAVSA